MRPFNKVAIVGIGLIGGSLALAIKKKKLAQEVIGVARHKETLRLAKQKGAIDKGFTDIKAIKDADLVILATPVSAIIKLAPLVSKIISPCCIVTDVGSTKQAIVSRLEKIFPKYIGSHPLAGSEKRGISYANNFIFKETLCILTPTKNTDSQALRKVKSLWLSLEARVVILTAQRHDKIISLTSHLPHAAAFSLIEAVPKKYLGFGSSGLKDTTRIAASEPELWGDIFLTNPKNAVRAIGLLRKNLSKIELAIQKGDRESLNKILKDAKKKREVLG